MQLIKYKRYQNLPITKISVVAHGCSFAHVKTHSIIEGFYIIQTNPTCELCNAQMESVHQVFKILCVIHVT